MTAEKQKEPVLLQRDAYRTHMHIVICAVVWCLSACLSVTSLYSVKTDEWVKLVSYSVLKKNFEHLENLPSDTLD